MSIFYEALEGGRQGWMDGKSDENIRGKNKEGRFGRMSQYVHILYCAFLLL